MNRRDGEGGFSREVSQRSAKSSARSYVRTTKISCSALFLDLFCSLVGIALDLAEAGRLQVVIPQSEANQRKIVRDVAMKERLKNRGRWPTVRPPRLGSPMLRLLAQTPGIAAPARSTGSLGAAERCGG